VSLLLNPLLFVVQPNKPLASPALPSHNLRMTKAAGKSTTQAPVAKAFKRRGVTVLPPAVPSKASLLRIRKAVQTAARKHAEPVAG
jgi:hypothetical protein